MFAGTHQILTKKEPDESLTIQKRISGNYKYFYHNGSLGLGDLESEIYKLANLTGFKNELLKIKIKVPGYNMEKYLTSKEKMVSFKGLYRKENMGTGKLSLDLMLGMKAIRELRSHALVSRSFNQSALQRLEKWFSDKNNKRWEVCTTLLKGKISLIGRKLCKMQRLKETKSAMVLAFKSLIKMQGELGKRKLEGFSKHFSSFGKAMIKNQFVFRGILDKIKDGDYHIVVRWEGEKFPKGELIVKPSKNFKFKGIKRIRK